MKVLILFISISFTVFTQDSSKVRRFAHEIQLNTFSVMISDRPIRDIQQFGGNEINYQFLFNATKHFSFGVRTGYFYFSRNNDRYQMFPIYLTSNLYFNKNKKVGLSVDLGKPMLLYQDSRAIGDFYWGLSNENDSYSFRQKIGMIGQMSIKFELFRGLKMYSGLNFYRTLKLEKSNESWLYTHGVRLGLAYQF